MENRNMNNLCFRASPAGTLLLPLATQCSLDLPSLRPRVKKTQLDEKRSLLSVFIIACLTFLFFQQYSNGFKDEFMTVNRPA